MAHHAVLVGAAQVLTCYHEAVSLLGHTGDCHALTQMRG